MPVCVADQSFLTQVAFALGTLFCKDVPFERFLINNFTGAGYFKALLGAGVGLNLWHFIVILLLRPRRRPEMTGTYGAMWAICF